MTDMTPIVVQVSGAIAAGIAPDYHTNTPEGRQLVAEHACDIMRRVLEIVFSPPAQVSESETPPLAGVGEHL